VELAPAIMVDISTPFPLIAATALESLVQEQEDRSIPQERSAETVKQRPTDPLNELREETIALNTHRLKYAKYSSEIKRRIYANWRYPEEARQARLQGQLLLEFGILYNGDLAGIKVLNSSGHYHLDQGTIDAINAATPFPPLPPHFQLDRLNFRARFFYRLVAES
jgi:TonB family protein